MTIIGTWDTTMKTPVGTVAAAFTFTDADGTLAGTAEGGGDTVDMHDVTAHEGNRYTWTQTVNKPMRLNLAFDVEIEGDTLRGTSRAGRLPKSTVTGTRRLAL